MFEDARLITKIFLTRPVDKRHCEVEGRKAISKMSLPAKLRSFQHFLWIY